MTHRITVRVRVNGTGWYTGNAFQQTSVWSKFSFSFRAKKTTVIFIVTLSLTDKVVCLANGFAVFDGTIFCGCHRGFHVRSVPIIKTNLICFAECKRELSFLSYTRRVFRWFWLHFFFPCVYHTLSLQPSFSQGQNLSRFIAGLSSKLTIRFKGQCTGRDRGYTGCFHAIYCRSS